MAQSLKQIKNRIRSVENTSKVTHAMEMISIAKLRASETKVPAQKLYFNKIQELLTNLLSSSRNITHPLASERILKEKIALCVITSDTGLCSVYNNNIIRLAENFISQQGKGRVILVTVGKKGHSYFKRNGMEIADKFLELNGRFTQEASERIINGLRGLFISKRTDEVYIAYTHYESLSRHKPTVEKILNIGFAVNAKEMKYILEPDINGVLEQLIPVYLSNKMKSILLDSFSCEHAARMIAMAEATNNAKDLLEGLVLSRNKIRQANITKEIIEVVSAAQTLR